MRPLVQQWRGEFASIDVSDEVLLKSARLYVAGKRMFARNRWDFVGVKCQFELLDNYGLAVKDILAATHKVLARK